MTPPTPPPGPAPADDHPRPRLAVSSCLLRLPRHTSGPPGVPIDGRLNDPRTGDRDDLEFDYRRAFADALATRPDRGGNANALSHVFGPLSEHLDRARRHDIVAAIESYRRGESPLSVPVALLRHDAEREHLAYLAEQTYLNPFPADLVLCQHL